MKTRPIFLPLTSLFLIHMFLSHPVSFAASPMSLSVSLRRHVMSVKPIKGCDGLSCIPTQICCNPHTAIILLSFNLHSLSLDAFVFFQFDGGHIEMKDTGKKTRTKDHKQTASSSPLCLAHYSRSIRSCLRRWPLSQVGCCKSVTSDKKRLANSKPSAPLEMNR